MTLLEEEIDNVNRAGVLFKFPTITVTIHTEKENYNIEYLSHIDIGKDFNKTLLPSISLDFLIPLGDFRDIILRQRDKLEATIVFTYSDEVVTREYKLFLLNTDRKYDTSKFNVKTRGELNKLDVIMVKAQCVDNIIYPLKKATVDGVFHECTVSDVTKGLISNLMNDVTIGGKKVKFKIIMDECDNSRKYEHLILPSNSNVIKLPYLLQNRDYGIYNGDINTFITRDSDNTYIINIYPIYDYTRYDKDKDRDRLIIYNSARVTGGTSDKSHLYEESSRDYKIITDDIQIIDRGEIGLTYGDELLITNPYSLVGKVGLDVTDDKVNYDNSSIMSSDALKMNDTGLSKQIDTKMDDNLFKYRAAVLKSTVVLSQVKLSKTDPRIFKPGMRILFVYYKDKESKKVRGVIQNIDSNYNMASKTVTTLLTFITERAWTNI